MDPNPLASPHQEAGGECQEDHPRAPGPRESAPARSWPMMLSRIWTSAEAVPVLPWLRPGNVVSRTPPRADANAFRGAPSRVQLRLMPDRSASAWSIVGWAWRNSFRPEGRTPQECPEGGRNYCSSSRRRTVTGSAPSSCDERSWQRIGGVGSLRLRTLLPEGRESVDRHAPGAERRRKCSTIWTNAALELSTVQTDVQTWPVPSLSWFAEPRWDGAGLLAYLGQTPRMCHRNGSPR
jgi:hypothetical protein